MVRTYQALEQYYPKLNFRKIRKNCKKKFSGGTPKRQNVGGGGWWLCKNIFLHLKNYIFRSCEIFYGREKCWGGVGPIYFWGLIKCGRHVNRKKQKSLKIADHLPRLAKRAELPSWGFGGRCEPPKFF